MSQRKQFERMLTLLEELIDRHECYWGEDAWDDKQLRPISRNLRAAAKRYRAELTTALREDLAAWERGAPIVDDWWRPVVVREQAG